MVRKVNFPIRIAGDTTVNVIKSQRLTNVFFFLLAAGRVALFPFLTLYFRLLGLSATQTGLICGAKSIVMLMTCPLWMNCATRFRRRRSIMGMSMVFIIITYLSLMLVPVVDKDESLLFCHHHSNLSSAVGLNDSQTVSNTSAAPINVTGLAVTTITAVTKTVSENNSTLNNGTSEHQTNNVTATIETKETPSSVTKVDNRNTPLETRPRTSPGQVTGSTKHLSPDPRPSSHQGESTQPKPSSQDVKISHSRPTIHHRPTTHEGRPTPVQHNDEITNALPSSKKIPTNAEVNLATNGEEKEQFNNDDDFNWLNPGPVEKTNDNSRRKRREIPPTLSRISNRVKDKISTWTNGLYALDYRTFIIVMSIIMIGELFSSTLEVLADNTWHDYLEKIDDVEKYGSQRYWASIGTAIVASVVVSLVDNTECLLQFGIHHFMIHFYLFAAIFIITFFFAIFYPVHSQEKLNHMGKTKVWCRVICSDCRSGLYIVTIIILGAVYAPANNFLFWLVEDKGGSELQMGLALTVAALAEFMMYMFGGKHIRKLGHDKVICIGLFTSSLRLLYYSFLWHPWAVVPIEVLHGLSHTAVFLAIINYPDFCGSFRSERCILLIFHLLYHGVGYGLGSFLSGYFIDVMGSIPHVFQAASAMTGLWFVIFAIATRCLPRRQKHKYAKILQDENNLTDSSDEDDWLELALKDH